MNSIYQQILVNLKVLSKVEDNGRLSTKNAINLSLEDRKKTQSVFRWLTGDSRDSCIEATSNLLDMTIEYTNTLMTNMRTVHEADEVDRYQMEKYRENNDQLNNIVIEMRNAIEGIAKLAGTYHKDAQTASKLDVLRGHLSAQIKRIDGFLVEVENAGKL